MNTVPTKGRRPGIEEDLAFQQKDWRVQRVGWAGFALVILAGLAGLLGSGPLSNARTGGGDAPEVQYQRFVRHGAQADLTIRTVAASAEPLRVAISRAYLAAVHLQQVLPTPQRVHHAGSMLVYTFERPEQADNVDVRFVFQPDELGYHEAWISTGTGSAAAIRQFTYP